MENSMEKNIFPIESFAKYKYVRICMQIHTYDELILYDTCTNIRTCVQ